MCHCPFLDDTHALCSPKWEQSPQTAGRIWLEWGEETTNVFIVTGRGRVWLYGYMLSGASYLMFSWSYQNTRNDVFKPEKISYERKHFRHVLRYGCPKILPKRSQRKTKLSVKDSKTLRHIKSPLKQYMQSFSHHCCTHTASRNVKGFTLCGCRAIFKEWKHERQTYQTVPSERENQIITFSWLLWSKRVRSNNVPFYSRQKSAKFPFLWNCINLPWNRCR